MVVGVTPPPTIHQRIPGPRGSPLTPEAAVVCLPPTHTAGHTVAGGAAERRRAPAAGHPRIGAADGAAVAAGPAVRVQHTRCAAAGGGGELPGWACEKLFL